MCLLVVLITHMYFACLFYEVINCYKYPFLCILCVLYSIDYLSLQNLASKNIYSILWIHMYKQIKTELIKSEYYSYFHSLILNFIHNLSVLKITLARRILKSHLAA